MHSALVRRLFYPLHERLRGRTTLADLARLEQTQWLAREELRALQWQKLTRLLQHAYGHVPYYRALFESLGAQPADIKSEPDFQRLPFLTKETIRRELHSLTADTHRDRLIRYSTGGSTGEPLIFFTDKGKEAAHNAAKLRARRWWGVDVGDRQVDLWGSPIELSRQDRVRVFKDRHLLNFTLLSAFNLTEASIRGYLDCMRSFQPVLLYGYATVFYRVALFCEERGIAPGLTALKAIVTTAEMLYEHQRERIASVFRRPVVNEYGCRDGGFVAQECPAGRLHVAMEHVYLEFLPIPGDPSGPGEIVITNLDAYGMPLIRYRVGDLGVPAAGTCDCGRGLALLESVQGRTNDMLVSPSGRVLHSLSVIYVLRETPGIKQFKVTQLTRDRLTVDLVPSHGFSPAAEGAIREGLRRVMRAPIEVDIAVLPEIQPEASGKYRWVVSKVPQPV